MGIGKQVWSVLLKLKIVSSSDMLQNDQRPARNIMVLARLPEDRSETLKNLQAPLHTVEAIHT
eukprot:11410489-Heterocapsa_arctica.AAC.1